MVETRAVCYVCGMPAEHRCALDGRSVCSLHYDKKTGMCTAHRIRQ